MQRSVVSAVAFNLVPSLSFFSTMPAPDTSQMSLAICSGFSKLRDQRTASRRQLRRKFSNQLGALKGKDVLKLAYRLLREPKIPRFVIFELVQHHDGARKAVDRAVLERLGAGMNSWWVVDSFACYLSGPAWREGQISDKVIESWAASDDLWWRRAALASTIPLNCRTRGGKGDVRRTIQICSLLVGDREEMVVKALSWSLRELAKREPDTVALFLTQNRDLLAPRVVREVTNKLTTGLKNPTAKRT